MELTKELPEPAEALCTCGHLFLLHLSNDQGQRECEACKMEGNYCGLPVDSGKRIVLISIDDLANLPPLE